MQTFFFSTNQWFPVASGYLHIHSPTSMASFVGRNRVFHRARKCSQSAKSSLLDTTNFSLQCVQGMDNIISALHNIPRGSENTSLLTYNAVSFFIMRKDFCSEMAKRDEEFCDADSSTRLRPRLRTKISFHSSVMESSTPSYYQCQAMSTNQHPHGRASISPQ